MGYRARRLVLAVVALVFVAAACSGSSEEAAVERPTVTETPDEPTSEAIEQPAEEPSATPEPTPVALTDDEKIAAAIAVFDAEPQPSDLIAWDHLGASLTANTVRLTVCAWDGLTVYDSQRIVDYEVVTATTGQPAVRFLASTSTLDECLNAELVETALAFTRPYDEYWSGVLADPTTFDLERSEELTTPGLLKRDQERVAGWTTDGLHWRAENLDADLPDSSLTDILWRRYELEPFNILELMACREVNDDYGLYRGGILVNGFTDDVSGTHAIDRYQFTRINGEWVVGGVVSVIRANCFFTDDWLQGVNEWQPEPVLWQRLPDAQ